MTAQIATATYSAEDNKLRLYASERLDEEVFLRIKKMGFNWAPRQELFVAPRWTPEREDLCIELAGKITAEQTTLIERAEAKAERLDQLATKRAQECDAFANAARQISQRFEFGQPILVGHHSERKARNDQQKMHNQMDKASKAFKAIDYWQYRATGVERHANSKGSVRTRTNRIKKLLAELRDMQRGTNHAHYVVGVWQKIAKIEDPEKFGETVERLCGSRTKDGSMSIDIYDQVKNGEISHRKACEKNIAAFEQSAVSVRRARWVNHILNRLGFETDQLGAVALYTGELTATILQLFTRTHGADKPKATNNDGIWSVTSVVPLPAHLSQSNTLTLSDDQWRALMVSVGFEVIIKERRKSNKPKPAPLINPSAEDAKALQDKWNTEALAGKYASRLNPEKMQSPVAVKQGIYSKYSGGSYSNLKTVSLDEFGDVIREHWSRPTPESSCRIRIYTGEGQLYGPSTVVTISDKPHKPFPFELCATNKEAANG